MAYTKTIEYKGLIVENAYHRIDVTSSSDGICKGVLNTYVNRESFVNGEGYLTSDQFEFPLQYGSDVGADKNQGYDYLLSLEENKDAINIFEVGQPD